MALTAQQNRDTAAYWANICFVAAQITATYSLDQIQTAVTTIDNAFDTTLNTAVAAGHGAETVIQALASVIPAPFSSATVQQKTLLACYVLMKRAGIL